VQCELGGDNNKYLIALLKQAQENCSVFPSTISKWTYNDVKKDVKNHVDFYKPWYIGLVGFCASYNGKWFGGYAKDTLTMIGTTRYYINEAIRNLIEQSKYLHGIDFVALKDYSEITNVIYPLQNAVIYCDPPYKGTTGYQSKDFDYERFYNWCREMTAYGHTVLVSEYQMPEDFECIWQQELKCTLDHNSRSNRIEKLFICRKD